MATQWYKDGGGGLEAVTQSLSRAKSTNAMRPSSTRGKGKELSDTEIGLSQTLTHVASRLPSLQTEQQEESQAAFFRAACYKKECEELSAELGTLRALCAEKEKESARLQSENDSLETRVNTMTLIEANLKKDLLRMQEEQMVNLDMMDLLRAEKSSLETDRDALSHRSGILEQNLRIQEQNIKTLKNLAVSLSSEVEGYKARMDIQGKEHKIAELKLQEELAKETSALRNEFETKMTQLRKLLDESDDMRQRSAAEWHEREMRVEHNMHEELRTKDAEVMELRKRLEELLRQQMATMKSHLEERNDTRPLYGPGNHCSSRRNLLSLINPKIRDLKQETDEVFRDMHHGQRIVQLLVTSTREEGSAVTWTPGRGVRHNFDPRGRVFQIRLHADPSELTLVSQTEGDMTISSLEGPERRMHWSFFTKGSARLNVMLEIVPA